MTDVRQRILTIAEAEDGCADEYRYTVPELGYRTAAHVPWCGLFALWCYRQAEIVPVGVRWVVEKGFASTHLRQIAPAKALPADLVYFNKFNHHALVDRVEGPDLWTWDGNSQGGRVCHTRRRVTDAAAAYSIQGWIAGASVNTAPPAVQTTADQVRELQRDLIAAGYDPGPVDGVPGPRTERALLAWALAHHGAV